MPLIHETKLPPDVQTSETALAQQRAGRMTTSYWIGWSLFRFIFSLYFRWRVYGAEKVPQTGSVILASNHASYLDPPLVGSAMQRMLNYMARETLFRFPIVGRILRSWNAVPLDRDRGSAAGLRIILDRLNEGDAILLFPEGTRTSDGTLQPAQSGIGLIVMKSNAPVVPVRIFGTYEAYGRHMRFPSPKRVTVKFGDPLNFDRFREEAKTCPKARLKEIYQEVADEVLAAIAKIEQ